MLGDEKSTEFFSESKRQSKTRESKSFESVEGADAVAVGQLLDANLEGAAQDQTNVQAKNENDAVSTLAHFLTLIWSVVMLGFQTVNPNRIRGWSLVKKGTRASVLGDTPLVVGASSKR